VHVRPFAVVLQPHCGQRVLVYPFVRAAIKKPLAGVRHDKVSACTPAKSFGPLRGVEFGLQLRHDAATAAVGDHPNADPAVHQAIEAFREVRERAAQCRIKAATDKIEQATKAANIEDGSENVQEARSADAAAVLLALHALGNVDEELQCVRDGVRNIDGAVLPAEEADVTGVCHHPFLVPHMLARGVHGAVGAAHDLAAQSELRARFALFEPRIDA